MLIFLYYSLPFVEVQCRPGSVARRWLSSCESALYAGRRCALRGQPAVDPTQQSIPLAHRFGHPAASLILRSRLADRSHRCESERSRADPLVSRIILYSNSGLSFTELYCTVLYCTRRLRADVSGTRFIYEHVEHLASLEQLRFIRARECEHLDDAGVSKIAMLFPRFLHFYLHLFNF